MFEKNKLETAFIKEIDSYGMPIVVMVHDVHM